jgi:hypothetical protein
MWEKLVTGVTRAGLMLTLLCCAARPSASPEQVAPALEAAAQTWTSPRLGYQWTLSPEWEFYPSSEIGFTQPNLPFDVVGARKKGTRRPSALLCVFDYAFGEHRKNRSSDPSYYADLERVGRELLEAKDIEFLGARRIELFGEPGVEVVHWSHRRPRSRACCIFGSHDLASSSMLPTIRG